MKSFKSFYEEMTFKVEVEGLPAMFIGGNSPGEVKSHLRKLIKQPSMIKSVERQTKHDVKKMYRKRAQGKDIDESTEISELSPATVKSYKKKASDSNYRAATKYARVANSPTSRKYKNKEMDKQDDIMRKRKAGLAMADKRESTELDERTPIRPTVQDKKLKNLRIPNPNYKDGIKRKPKQKRAMYNDVCSETKSADVKPEKYTDSNGKTRYRMVPTTKEDCGCEKCRAKRVDEKLTIGKIRRAAYKTGKVLGDVQAVKKNKVGKRIARRAAGKVTGRLLGKLFK